MSDLIETSHFNTASLPAPQRFAAWRESMSVVFEINSYDDTTRERCFAKLDSFLLDDVVISHCRLGAQTFLRDTSRIARDGVDHYQLHVFLSGSVEMECAGRTTTARTGDFVNLDHGETFASRTTDYAIINLFIPRRRLAPLLRTPDSTHGAVFDSRTGAGRLLRDYVMSLYRAGHAITLDQAPLAAEALLQVAALALNGVIIDERDPPARADHALLLKAQLFIKDNLHAPELGPEIVAHAMGLSRSRLYRIFAPCGGVADYIREMRLRRAFSDLISRRHAHRQISQIAYGWGFKDPAHFARAFRNRFGAWPGEVRRNRVETVLAAKGAEDLPAGDIKYAFWIQAIA